MRKIHIVGGLRNGQVLQRRDAAAAAEATPCVRLIVKLSGWGSRDEDGHENGAYSLIATLSCDGHALNGWDGMELTGRLLPEVKENGGKTQQARLYEIFLDEHAPLPAGGPYSLRLALRASDFAAAVVDPFYVGDVWILGGQSNMEGAGRLPAVALSGEDAESSAGLIRAFSLGREWRQAVEPLHLCGESPDRCHHSGSQIGKDAAELLRTRAAVGAGVGRHFAHALRRLMGKDAVPIGLICAAKGGSAMSQWNPEDTCTATSLYASIMAGLHAAGNPVPDGEDEDNDEDSTRALLRPIAVAGVLWYQGESDTGCQPAAVYTSRMQDLVGALRRDLLQPRLPWVIVQLGRVKRAGAAEYWNSIQEQQRLLPQVIPHLQVVAAIDLSLDDEIHISREGFPVLARRMALATRGLLSPRLRDVRRVYRTVNDGPKTPRMEIVAIDVRFSLHPGACMDGKAEESRLCSNGEPHGFCLLDAAGSELHYIYKTTLHGDVARLHLMRTPPPGARVAYGQGYSPYANIADNAGRAVPVCAPQPVLGIETTGLEPFITQWHVAPVWETQTLLSDAQPPDFQQNDASFPLKTYGASGFIDEHANWSGKWGLAFFGTHLDVADTDAGQAGRLDLLLGYDGPVKLWVDNAPVYCDMQGWNPCVEDEARIELNLGKGRHSLVVGMETNGGRAWGFFLRPWRQACQSIIT